MINHNDFNKVLEESGKSIQELSWDTGISSFQLQELTERDCWDELSYDDQDQLQDALPDLRWY